MRYLCLALLQRQKSFKSRVHADYSSRSRRRAAKALNSKVNRKSQSTHQDVAIAVVKSYSFWSRLQFKPDGNTSEELKADISLLA